jgi:hypothetical protein
MQRIFARARTVLSGHNPTAKGYTPAIYCIRYCSLEMIAGSELLTLVRLEVILLSHVASNFERGSCYSGRLMQLSCGPLGPHHVTYTAS